MFDVNNEQFFLFGLAAFLVTQVLYAFAFFQQKQPGKFKLSYRNTALMIFFISLYVLLITLLWNKLNDMLIPVLVYGAVLCIMGYCSSIRNVNTVSYYFVLVGSLLFISSDSLIALNKFLFSSQFTFVPFFIMSLYVFAQYLIVAGCIISYRE